MQKVSERTLKVESVDLSLNFCTKRTLTIHKMLLIIPKAVETCMVNSIWWKVLIDDTCVFYRSKWIFADIIKYWKVISSVNLFCRVELLVKVSSGYHLYVPGHSMVFIFACKFWSVKYYHLGNWFGIFRGRSFQEILWYQQQIVSIVFHIQFLKTFCRI